MKIVDLTRKRFGRLTVVRSLKSSRGGSRLWECLCDCGNVVFGTTRHLNRKKNVVRSCGCLKNIKGKEHKDWKGHEEISGQWWSSHVLRENSQTARVRVEVTLTKEEAWELFLKQNRKCALSGISLTIHKSGSKNTASIDRIDSAKGYTLDNVQWVHKHINFMKRNYSQDYFIEMCKKVAKTHE